MTDVRRCSEIDFLFLFLRIQNNIFLTLYLIQLPRWHLLELLPLFVHCGIARGMGMNLCAKFMDLNTFTAT